MELEKQASKIRQGLVSLPGSRDRANGPILVVDVAQCGLHSKDKSETTENSMQYENLVSLLGYLAQIPEDEARAQGFTVLIDGRKAPLKYLRRALRACQQALYRMVRHVVIVQPERFFEQQRLNFDLLKEAYEFKTSLTSVHRLTKYIDVAQLPESLGGTFRYDASFWVDLRKKYEDFIVKVNNWLHTIKRHEGQNITDAALQDSNNLAKKAATVSTAELYKMGNDLLDDLLPIDATTLRSGNSDWNDAAKKIEQLLKQLKEIQKFPSQDSKKIQQHKVASSKLAEDYSQGVDNLISWICGAGEKWLLTLHEIGDSADDARQLVKEHLELEAKSRELMSQVDELNDMADTLMVEFPKSLNRVEASKMRLNKMMKAFCCRIQRQKRISLQSVFFHEKLNDFSRTTDVLLESLCTEVNAESSDEVNIEKYRLEEKAGRMENIYHDVIETGISFIDELCVDESNSTGRAIARDYSAAIVHIRSRMDETRDRRRRCQDLLDVRRLKLQQLLQLYTCENDGEQAIKWIEELYETMVNNYNEVNFGNTEIGIFRDDRAKLEETARGIYEYAKQLCQAALVLRRSLRMELQPQFALNQELERLWGKFCHALSESEANINITMAFYTTASEVNHKLDELNEKLVGGNAETNPRRRSTYAISWEKNRLSGDMRELKHMVAILSKQLDSKFSRNKCTGTREADMRQDIQQQLKEIEEKFRSLDFNISKSLETICHGPKLTRLSEREILCTSSASTGNRVVSDARVDFGHNNSADVLNDVTQDASSEPEVKFRRKSVDDPRISPHALASEVI